MNHIYRVVYNAATNTYQAVPENSTGKHKTASEKSSCAVSDVSEKGAFFSLKPMALCAMAMGLSSTGAWAAPTGGHISAGDASIAQHGKITNIQQNSQKAAINWQTFGIKADETVNFKQPNAQAVILNRVIGNEKSVIDGAMNANGKVFISNPNGMIIGKNAQINVGALLATTAKIKDQDFMNGFFKFDEATGDITHLGDIKVPTGGVVALIAPIVANKGNITAPQGKVLLASAEQFSITLPDNGQFAYTLDRGTLQGLVDNGGAILADGGYVILTAKGTDAVKKSLIKHTGKIEANTVQNKNGVIELLGDLDNTRLEASGSLKAEAEQGDGGFVETSAAELGINDLQVSTQSKYGKTGTWLIDPKDFTVAPSGGDMTGKKVEEGLQTNNVTLKSRDGAKEGKGDVIINDEISWDKNTLTLNAENDIHINKTLNGTGTAKLALEYGQGTVEGKYKAIVNGKETELDNDYYLDKNTPLKDRTVKVNLPEGRNFSTKQGNKGEVVEFNVIHKMPEIVKNTNNDWESKFTERHIAFGKDMDIGFTKNYDGFAGWKLRGQLGQYEANRVAGLGHTISNLTLHSKQNYEDTGLFQQHDFGNFSYVAGYLRDIGVTNVNIRSDGKFSETGGLAGGSYNVSNSYVTGSVSSTGNGSLTGGLVGKGRAIFNSYSTAEVSSMGRDSSTGGLVGDGSQISNSYAMGNVSSTGINSPVGGLIGQGYSISNSYATGNVSSSGNHSVTGGLVGAGSTILGYGGRNIFNSYATGNVSSSGKEASTGGLVGSGDNISNSYATGNVSSLAEGVDTGGLVGSGWYIVNSYANNTKLSANTKSYLGGLVGYYGEYNRTGNFENSFFNQDKFPNLQASGKYYEDRTINVTGKTEAQLKDRATFEGWDFDKVWYINDGEMPKLRAHKKGTIVITPTSPTTPPTTTPNTPVVTPTAPTNPTQPVKKTDLSIQANNLNKVYDSKPVANESDLRAIAKENGYTDIVSITGLQNGDTLDKLGTLRYDGKGNTWQNAKNAGEYKIVPSGLTGGQDYEIKYGEGSLTIEPKKITVEGVREYDGTHDAYQPLSLVMGIKSQLIPADKDNLGALDIPTLTGRGKLAQKDASTEKIKLTEKGTLAFSGSTQKTKDVMKNYAIDTQNSYWTINKRPLTIQAMNNIKPEGENNPDVSRIGITVQGLVDGESISDVNLTYSDDKKRQGEVSVIRVGEPVFKNGKASNYEITKNHGKLLTVQQQYDVKNITDKKPEDVAKIRDLLNPVEDEFLLAEAVYKDNNTQKFREVYAVIDKISNKVVDKILYDEGISPQDSELFKYEKMYILVDKVDRTKNDYANGLGLALFKKNGTENFYLVFRGTDSKSTLGVINPFDPEGDGGANQGQQHGFLPEQYKEALNIANQIVNDNRVQNLTIVGHSLGGGLATYVANQLNNDYRTVAINPSTLHKNNIKNNFKLYKNIDNFIFDNEVNQLIKSDIANTWNILTMDGNTKYIGNFNKINLLSHNVNLVPIFDERVDDHQTYHVIKTQRLADLMAKNNEILANCQKTGCQQLRENQWTPAAKVEEIKKNVGDSIRINAEIANTMHQKFGHEVDLAGRESIYLLDPNKPIAVVDQSLLGTKNRDRIVFVEKGRELGKQILELKEWNIEHGDIIRTIGKKVIIYFTDGSWVELAPYTVVRVDFSNKTDDVFIADCLIVIKPSQGEILTKGKKQNK